MRSCGNKVNRSLRAGSTILLALCVTLTASVLDAQASFLGLWDPAPRPSTGYRSHPADEVDPRSGQVNLSGTQFTLEGLGPDTIVARTYVGPDVRAGSMGVGWRFSLDQWLQMYAGFNITEWRGDGSWRTYWFRPADEDAYVNSFDGDELIYYDLNVGHYVPDTIYNLAGLIRVNQDRYEVRYPEGSVYVYAGYYAPWRDPQSPTAGRLAEIQDADGNKVIYTYDDEGRLVRLTDAAGRTFELAYEDSSNPLLLTSLTDPLGHTWIYSYSREGLLTSATTPEGLTTTYRYNDNGWLTAVVSPKGTTTAYTRDGEGRVIEVRATGYDPARFSYEDNGQRVIRANLDGRQQFWEYDEFGRLVSYIHLDGGVYTYIYDDRGLLMEFITPAGRWSMIYDKSGAW